MDSEAKRRTTETDLERMLSDETAEPAALPLSLLEKITHDFSNDLVSGRGGFAVVFQGILENGSIVAVKRLSSMYVSDKVFQGEVECLMKVKHKNLVRFVGYCADTKGSMEMYNGKLVMAETQQRLLCFEYLPKGCLEDYITDSSRGLEWRTRYEIIKGICEGLNYLHKNQFLHLDLKPSNILMDNYMMPKIIDFGHSRLFEEKQTRVITKNISGTLGYLPPEFDSHQITYKFDLYSLGVIILEILTGKKGYHAAEDILESWSTRSDSSQWEQIRVCAQIGIECTEFNPSRRPSMEYIICRLLATESTQIILAGEQSENLVLRQFTLCFPFEPNKVVTCSLQLKNNTDRHVAFRLMEKSDESFLMLPLYGIVPPRSPYTLSVTTKVHKELPQKCNMDLILDSVTTSEDDYIVSFQKSNNTKNVMQEIKLKAVYIPRREEIHLSECMMFEEGAEPKALRLSLLEDITNGFSDKQKISSGDFSMVYKGTLDNGIVVTVKRLFTDHLYGNRFQVEVEHLMKLKHKNIAKFLGYCAETIGTMVERNGKFGMEDKVERLLCFENLPKGCLEHYIEDLSGGLEWSKRYTIIKGICEGLNYLHEKNILHLGLEPRYIFLDEEMTPKVIDFSHSWCLEEGPTPVIATEVLGRLDYLAPEIIERRESTYKSDIFSLGVIIIEMLTGKRSCHAVSNVLESWSTRTYISQWKQIRVCTELWRECTHTDPSKRPTSMKHIINMLLETENTQITPASAPSELLILHQFHLCFPFEPNKVIKCPLQLTNNSNSDVAFRLTDKNEESSLRLPLYGIVPAGSTYTLIVTTQEHKDLPQNSSMDLILDSTTILWDDYIDTSQSEPDFLFQKAKMTGRAVPLRAFYTPPQGMKDSYEKPQSDGNKGAQTTNSKTKAAEDWMTEHRLIGRDSEMNDLRQYTFMARLYGFQVMSVWGIAGVGKSALLKWLFCDRILNDSHSIFEKYAWVDVSYPFNLWDFSRSLLLSFHSPHLQAHKDHDVDTVESKNPISECRDILKHHMCLVVFDGLQSTKEWDLIEAELVSESSTNCIIVITTEARLAKYCGGNKCVSNLKCLQADAASELFKKVVALPPGLFEREGAEIHELISKCGGLPKVIVDIARSLATKSVGWIDCASAINDNFMHVLENNREFDSLNGLFTWIHNYFRSCPDSLKPCIVYLSIFPRDHIIRRRRLVRRWIAEGYSRDNNEESAELIGEKQFSDLLDLSIIQQSQEKTVIGDTRMVSCQVNGFISEYTVKWRIEENLVFELGRSSSLTTQRTGHHLVILEHWHRDMIVFRSINFSQLQSLTVFGKWESYFVSESMKLLQVLDLEDASGRVEYEDLEKMVKWLRCLKFLSLRGRREIYHLPGSLHHLRQLQSLDVRHTSIVTLPENITKLEKLQYIRAGTTDVPISAEPPHVSSRWSCNHGGLLGVEVPRGIGNLTALHTLGVVDVAASGSKGFAKDLKKLTQLRKLGVCGINQKNSKDLFSAIKDHVHLESLSVRLSKNNNQGCFFKKDKNHGCLDDMIALQCKNLKSLKLYGLEESLPKWGSNHLSKLTKLDLEMDTLTETDVKFLGKLPRLSILRVKQLQDGEIDFRILEHGEEYNSHEKVKVLQISCGCSSSYLRVKFGSRTMKKLELLTVDCCHGSPSYKFSGLENLRDLKQVFLLNASKADKLKKDLGQLLSELQTDSENPAVRLDWKN